MHIGRFFVNLSVKEFWEWVYIWRSCDQNHIPLFLNTVYFLLFILSVGKLYSFRCSVLAVGPFWRPINWNQMDFRPLIHGYTRPESFRSWLSKTAAGSVVSCVSDFSQNNRFVGNSVYGWRDSIFRPHSSRTRCFVSDRSESRQQKLGFFHRFVGFACDVFSVSRKSVIHSFIHSFTGIWQYMRIIRPNVGVHMLCYELQSSHPTKEYMTSWYVQVTTFDQRNVWRGMLHSNLRTTKDQKLS